MKKFINTLKFEIARHELFMRLKRFLLSPFLVALAISFLLWYIAKLNHTYTTDMRINIEVADQLIKSNCVVEGGGTNLFGYKLSFRRRLNIPLQELRYTINPQQDSITIDIASISRAISVKYSDIKIVDVDALTTLYISDELRQDIERAQ
ncbi:MAG: hypothetical protein SNH13_02855 [Rikenellaceae bacterium]